MAASAVNGAGAAAIQSSSAAQKGRSRRSRRGSPASRLPRTRSKLRWPKRRSSKLSPMCSPSDVDRGRVAVESEPDRTRAGRRGPQPSADLVGDLGREGDEAALSSPSKSETLVAVEPRDRAAAEIGREQLPGSPAVAVFAAEGDAVAVGRVAAAHPPWMRMPTGAANWSSPLLEERDPARLLGRAAAAATGGCGGGQSGTGSSQSERRAGRRRARGRGVAVLLGSSAPGSGRGRRARARDTSLGRQVAGRPAAARILRVRAAAPPARPARDRRRVRRAESSSERVPWVRASRAAGASRAGRRQAHEADGDQGGGRRRGEARGPPSVLRPARAGSTAAGAPRHRRSTGSAARRLLQQPLDRRRFRALQAARSAR